MHALLQKRNENQGKKWAFNWIYEFNELPRWLFSSISIEIICINLRYEFIRGLSKD